MELKRTVVMAISLLTTGKLKLKKTTGTALVHLLIAIAALTANAAQAPNDCDEMTVYNYSTAVCDGKATVGMPMTMIMTHANIFVAGDIQEGPRAQNKIAAPNMAMIEFGTTVGDTNYFNAEVMLTAEKWTFPKQGYPLLMQTGEENEDHQPFIDGQHPHSSPLMGLTFSDTITLGEANHLKFFASPRGQATEGPTAFMHRPSGEVNPDAPLGHHIGQDVSHITSSVLGAELRLKKFNTEISTFKGEEPQPTNVDLPTSKPDSYAARVTYRLTDEIHAMASAAYVNRPEAHDADLDHIWRYSFSMYTNAKISDWIFHDAFVYGLVNFYDHAGALNSWLYEAVLIKNRSTLWGRIEAVERTPDELAISQSNDRTTGRYVELITLGYTYTIAQHNDCKISAGGSVTKDFLPSDYQRDYGGNPLTAKVFVEVSGMKMSVN